MQYSSGVFSAKDKDEYCNEAWNKALKERNWYLNSNLQRKVQVSIFATTNYTIKKSAEFVKSISSQFHCWTKNKQHIVKWSEKKELKLKAH